LLKWVERFQGVPVLVIGDIMLDRSLRGSVDRISPEAPVPVIDVQEHTQTLGGAGNVVNNLAALGARPSLISVCGDDQQGKEVETELRSGGVNYSGLIVDPERPTITKTRVIAGHQQVVRLDVEKRGSLSKTVLHHLMKQIENLLPRQKGVILSDYGKGVITPPVIKTVIRLAHKHGVSITVDPKIEHFMQYKGVDCITPNTKEAIEGMRVLPPKTEAEMIELGWRIMKRLRAKSLLITRGEKGMMLFKKEESVKSIPTNAKEVFDVTGAGDTVVATFTLARSIGAPHFEAAQIANIAAGIVVGKLGTAVTSVKEISTAIRQLR